MPAPVSCAFRCRFNHALHAQAEQELAEFEKFIPVTLTESFSQPLRRPLPETFAQGDTGDEEPNSQSMHLGRKSISLQSIVEAALITASIAEWGGSVSVPLTLKLADSYNSPLQAAIHGKQASHVNALTQKHMHQRLNSRTPCFVSTIKSTSSQSGYAKSL